MEVNTMRKLLNLFLILSLVLTIMAVQAPAFAVETTGAGTSDAVQDRDRIQDMTSSGIQPMIQKRDQDRVQPLTEDQLTLRSQLRGQLQLGTEAQLQYQERLETALRTQAETQTANTNQYRLCFSDIETHWARDHIRWAYLWGLASGYPDGTFHPQGLITGLEGVLMTGHLVRDLKGIEPYTALDMDIDWSIIPVWAREALRDQTALRIMNQSQTYSQTPLNRYQLAVMLAKALELQKSEGPGPGMAPPFSDFEKIPADGRGYILSLWNLGLICGDNGKFEPDRLVTRAEAAALLMNVIHALDVMPSEWVVADGMKSLTLALDENPTTGYSWAYTMATEGILALESEELLQN
jgi:hypothetical protein